MSSSETVQSEQSIRSDYTPIPSALGHIEIMATNHTLPVVTKLVEALKRYQPGLDVTLLMDKSDPGRSWWRSGKMQAAAFYHGPMPQKDMRTFYKLHGYFPAQLRIAEDALIGIVHRNNPVTGSAIDLQSLQRIFGHPGHQAFRPIQTWGDAGLQGEWQERRIEPVGQIGTAFASVLFRDRVLGGRVYRPDMPRFQSQQQVIRAVASNTGAIGYLARRHLQTDVGLLRIIQGYGANQSRYLPDGTNDSKDPTVFWLYLYMDQDSENYLSAPLHALLSFCLSREGQEIVRALGYRHIDAELVNKDIKASGIRILPGRTSMTRF